MATEEEHKHRLDEIQTRISQQAAKAEKELLRQQSEQAERDLVQRDLAIKTRAAQTRMTNDVLEKGIHEIAERMGGGSYRHLTEDEAVIGYEWKKTTSKQKIVISAYAVDMGGKLEISCVAHTGDDVPINRLFSSSPKQFQIAFSSAAALEWFRDEMLTCFESVLPKVLET